MPINHCMKLLRNQINLQLIWWYHFKMFGSIASDNGNVRSFYCIEELQRNVIWFHVFVINEKIKIL